MKNFTKALIAGAVLALAAPAFATETGAGDRGPVNQVGPQSPGDTPPGNSTNTFDARRAAQDTYTNSMNYCRSLSGNARSTCRKEARIARDDALRNANQSPTVAVETLPRPAPGTTPADRGDARMARSQAQKDSGAKP